MDQMQLLPGLGQTPQNGAMIAPQQVTSLYNYANSLMSPVPVNQNGKMSWTQGVADLARSLMGGYLGHQADVMQQQGMANGAAQATPIIQALLERNGQPQGSAPSSIPTPAPTDQQQAPNSGIAGLITKAALDRGIDPNVALKVFGGESGLDPTRVGDNGSSFGVAQLHYGGIAPGGNAGPGLGDDFTKATGLNARDPRTTPQQINFALDNVAKNGWGAFHAAANMGIPDNAGVGQAPAQGQASSPNFSGIDPSQVSAMLVNPYVPEATKAMVLSLMQPHVISDAIGGHYLYSPAMEAPKPIVSGIHFQEGPGHAPIAVTGNPGNPQTSILTPGTNGLTPSSAGPSQGNESGAPSAPPGMAPYVPYIKFEQDTAAQGAAAHNAGSAAGNQLAQDRANASNFGQSIFPLQKALTDLQALGTTGTGPGSEQINEIKSFLLSRGVPGIDASKIQNFDEAKKYLVQYVNQTGNTGTNDKLAASFSGNPSVGISNAAAVDVVKSAIALQRMQQAKVMSFGKSGQPESNYSKYALDYSTNTDPRAFGLDMMTPEARKALNASLPAGSPERARFNASLQQAMDLGLVQHP